MSLKILSGKAKGLSLACLNSEEIRPTSVLLRRRLFDAHQNLQDYFFYDLYAGTGAMGLEAASRGATVFFNEKNKKHFALLQKNIKSYLLRDEEASLKSHMAKASDYLQNNRLGLEKNTPAIFFIDPPYELVDEYKRMASFFNASNLNCRLWVEACEKKTMTIPKMQQLWNAPLVKQYKQGSSYLLVFEFLDKE